MKVQLYAKKYRPEYTDTLIWEGEMQSVPRIGEQVFFYEGWGGVTIQRVYWDLESQSVEISFDDRSGEYTKEAERRITLGLRPGQIIQKEKSPEGL